MTGARMPKIARKDGFEGEQRPRGVGGSTPVMAVQRVPSNNEQTRFAEERLHVVVRRESSGDPRHFLRIGRIACRSMLRHWDGLIAGDHRIDERAIDRTR
ncbi:MAG: hypothetical protein ACOVSI_03840 [Gemmatimonas sp.]